MIDALLTALQTVLQPLPLFLILAGILTGIIMGSIPGMTATMTIAVLLSFTFGMDPGNGMMLLLGVYGGAVFAGSIPAILIRTPGTPAAAATIFDGYPLSQKGEAGRAIRISVISSFIGGMISVFALIFLSPVIADFALEFRSPEFFALALFGLTIIASVSGNSVAKGMISGLMGMLLATIGLDPITAHQRFTYDIPQLYQGVEFIAVMIGLFGIAEGLHRYSEGITTNRQVEQEINGYLPSLSDVKSVLPISLGTGVLGTLVGSIPGAGGDIASFLTYNEAKRWFDSDKNPFGEGNILGVASAESGNNASTGGALVPTFTLGIPGDTVSAVLIGALLIHNIQPGPELYTDHMDLLYTIFVGFGVIYVLILILGLAGVHYWVRIISIPSHYLWPGILVLCVIGSIALRSAVFDAWVMLIAGIVGFLLRQRAYPLAPMVLGLILGPIAETNFRRSLTISDGSYMIFLESHIALFFLMLCALALARPAYQSMSGFTDSS
ncbi:tripartite tricarboxylate transporter permease [Natrinema versiforme]|uniref:C4-dicarboxylate ABC transporter permease n=1 Tax=Natrinema versiforme TaxID=88724 RepID=A0A4P8WR23_9EURY|nr:tripartite tricarboxylate transporter permease [Natrinema versiforme]QCS44973.1 C4-dicarboxylate ABC transporter permease [Natrinema versiforme]